MFPVSTFPESEEIASKKVGRNIKVIYLNIAFQIDFYCLHWVSENKYGLHCLYLAKG